MILPNALTDYLVSEMRERNSRAVVTDRTVDEARPIVIIAVPIQKGGAVIARIDGAAIKQPSVSFQDEALTDAENRVPAARL